MPNTLRDSSSQLIRLQPQTLTLTDSLWEALQRRSRTFRQRRDSLRRLKQQELDAAEQAQYDTVCPFTPSGLPTNPFPLTEPYPAALHLPDTLLRPLPQANASYVFHAGAIPHRAQGEFRAETLVRTTPEPPLSGDVQASSLAFIIGVAFVSAFALLLYRIRYKEFFSAWANNRTTIRVEQAHASSTTRHAALFDLLYVLLLGYTVWYAALRILPNGAEQLGSPWILALFLGAALARYLYQFIVLHLCSLLLGQGAAGRQLWAQTQHPNRLAWLPLLFVAIAFTLVPSPGSRPFLYVALGLLALVILLRIVRLIAAFHCYRLHYFYFLLYLCALEFLPILLVCKWLKLY